MTSALAAVLLCACADRGGARVGIVLGSEGVRAAKLAAADLNAGPGRRIDLRVLDRAFGVGAQVALQGAESLAVDPAVMAVVGHANSSASIAASQVYNARHVVQVAPTTTSPLYSQAGPYSFRLVASDAYQAKFLVAQIARLPQQRLAVVYVNDDYGRSLRRLVTAELTATGARPVYEGPYAEGETENDVSDLVHALAAARPTALVWLGRSPFFALVVDPLRAAVPGLEILASDGFGGTVVDANTDARYAGVRYVRLVNVDSASPAMRRLQGRYREAGGGAVTDQVALAYDAVMLLGSAIREAGADRDAIRRWLNELGRTRPPFVGATGPISFSPQGDRTPTYVLVTAGGPAAAAGR